MGRCPRMGDLGSATRGVWVASEQLEPDILHRKDMVMGGLGDLLGGLLHAVLGLLGL
ncbi:hypothetical protein GCM10010289_56470 [Streptomyces violascens]|uniref:Uncharacterized protein n=1 Tax=Streptomyces violascens TaxID=67381 RepID=A0ABQ3QW85_9ACTN|nr:hypothetical protein GCM10010289_56470 [Streptomyces violascens]GHI41546.1 hypothetical protein Sviol_59540 [Streptomyces violascens]